MTPTAPSTFTVWRKLGSSVVKGDLRTTTRKAKVVKPSSSIATGLEFRRQPAHRDRPSLRSTSFHSQGCVVIFLSNFLGLLIQVDAAGQDNGNILGGLLVAINVLLALAVLMTSWFATQQQVRRSITGGGVLMIKHVLGIDYRPDHPYNARRSDMLGSRRPKPPLVSIAPAGSHQSCVATLKEVPRVQYIPSRIGCTPSAATDFDLRAHP